jgi:signal transduction histidine kinase
MVEVGIEPEALIGLHGAALDRLVPGGTGPSPDQEKLAQEILLATMMACALGYCHLAASRARDREAIAAHARTLEARNQDLSASQRDLSARHEKLVHTRETLRSLAQQQSDLLATVAHEVRTPLTSVLGYGEFLEEGTYGNLNPEQADILHRMVQGGRDVLQLINRLLDLSRLEAGRLVLDRQALKLGSVARAAIESVQGQALRKRQTLSCAIPADLPPVWADSLRLLEILVNLLGNAVKFAPEGGSVAVGARTADDSAEIWVRDSGPGIAAEAQRQLFEKFAQAPDGTRRYDSSGLGLALCKELVSLHGGRIWVDSQPGQGCTFRFTIPLYQEGTGRPAETAAL